MAQFLQLQIFVCAPHVSDRWGPLDISVILGFLAISMKHNTDAAFACPLTRASDRESGK